ncbi:MAG TPA: hypothetical protein VMR70_11680 [Flavisolibacter sp.]|nr:hypothetical protein [Flavisolibacter sp.]
MRVFLLPAILLFVGCTATKLTSSWTADNAGNRDYQKIMVVSILQREDTSLSKKMERHLAGDLKAAGYNAVGYREVFSEGELKGMRYDSIRRKLSEKGIDGVVTISLMTKEKEAVYVRERGNADPGSLPLGGFWQSPTLVRQERGKTGYYLTSTSYFWQSQFYDVATVDLLYASQSKAFEVLSTDDLAHRYGKMIVKDMEKNYVLSMK